MAALNPQERVEITGLTHDNVYNDVDLTSYLDAGAVGVTIEVVNTGATLRDVRIRKNGSASDLRNDVAAANYRFIMVGLDVNDVIEIKSPSSDLTFYIVAQFNTGAVLFTDVVDKSTATTGSWVDVDCTSDFGADAGSVEAAIFAFSSVGNVKNASFGAGVRKNGSTDTYESLLGNTGFLFYGIIGVDSGDIFEQYIDSANYDLKLCGYIKTSSGVTMITNPVAETASTTSAWTDLDVTARTSASTTGAIVRVGDATSGTDTTLTLRVRGNGSTLSETNSGLGSPGQLYSVIPVDADEILEYYYTETSKHLSIVGYIEGGGGTTTSTTTISTSSSTTTTSISTSSTTSTSTTTTSTSTSTSTTTTSTSTSSTTSTSSSTTTTSTSTSTTHSTSSSTTTTSTSSSSTTSLSTSTTTTQSVTTSTSTSTTTTSTSTSSTISTSTTTTSTSTSSTTTSTSSSTSTTTTSTSTSTSTTTTSTSSSSSTSTTTTLAITTSTSTSQTTTSTSTTTSSSTSTSSSSSTTITGDYVYSVDRVWEN